ncbi:MAG TPA: NAD-dependent epimerase/dehydratase family protein [Bacteroidota bacterium]
MSNLVTGGLGFVGRRIVEALLAEGESVNVLSLPTPGFPSAISRSYATFLGDIRDPVVVRKAMAGCKYVYHLAAYARNWARDPGTFFEVNVQGTDVVLRAALETGVEKVVYTSSNLALGPSNGSEVNEAHPRTTDFLTEYERSKFIAENLVRSYVRKGLDVVIVNPTRIYGPGPLDESNSVTKMILWYLQGKWRFILGNGDATGNYVFVDDIVQGHIRARKYGKPGENYILGGQNASFNEFFSTLAGIGGRTFRLFHLPAGLALLFSQIERARARTFRHYPLITPGWTRTFLANWENSCKKAEQELGYSPKSLKAGMEDTVKWLETNSLF